MVLVTQLTLLKRWQEGRRDCLCKNNWLPLLLTRPLLTSISRLCRKRRTVKSPSEGGEAELEAILTLGSSLQEMKNSLSFSRETQACFTPRCPEELLCCTTAMHRGPAVQGQKLPRLSLLVKLSCKLQIFTVQDWHLPELFFFRRLLAPASTLCTFLIYQQR